LPPDSTVVLGDYLAEAPKEVLLFKLFSKSIENSKKKISVFFLNNASGFEPDFVLKKCVYLYIVFSLQKQKTLIAFKSEREKNLHDYNTRIEKIYMKARGY